MDVVKRPIENVADRGVDLLRLEFEMFEQIEGRTLRSYRHYACRELIIGKLVEGRRDANIIAYSQSLGLSANAIDSPSEWLLLKERRPWISIQFGPKSSVDYRQSFEHIGSFDPQGWKIEEYGNVPRAERVSVEDAAEFLCQSPSTIRRRVDELARTHGETLLTFTDGRHRRINLDYLRLLLDD